MNKSRKFITPLLYKILDTRAHAEIRITNGTHAIFSFPTESEEKVKKLGFRDHDFTRCFAVRKCNINDPITFNTPLDCLTFLASDTCHIPHNLYVYATMGSPHCPRNRVGVVFDLSEITKDEMGTALQFCHTMIDRCNFKKQVKVQEKEKRIVMNTSI